MSLPGVLLFTKREGQLIGDMVVRGHCGHNDLEMTDEVRKWVNKTSSLDFWRVDFSQFIRPGHWYRDSLGKESLIMKGLRNARHTLWMKSPKHKSRPSLCAKRQAGREEDWPGWTGSFCLNSGKKGSLWPLEEEAGNSGRIQESD